MLLIISELVPDNRYDFRQFSNLKPHNHYIMATANWTVDPSHSEVQFKVKHLVISTVTGSFKSFSGTLDTISDDLVGAKASFSADINSIDTGMEQRDTHLKSAEFFDADNHPSLTFVSSNFKKLNDTQYSVEGNLTLHGVTKAVILKAEYGGTATDFYGNEKAGFEITGTINRKDFDLVWSAVTEAGNIVVSDDVKLLLNLQYTKSK
jgi:polyisoprenoid-binding protein YceI